MDIMKYIEKIPVEDAKKQYKNYKYCLIYYMSSREFNLTENIDNVNWEECQEAYFWGENSQMHIYQDDNELVAVVFEEKDADANDFLDKKYDLAYNKIGKKITVREYLSYDDDGQIYVAYKRMLEVEE